MPGPGPLFGAEGPVRAQTARGGELPPAGKDGKASHAAEKRLTSARRMAVREKRAAASQASAAARAERARRLL